MSTHEIMSKIEALKEWEAVIAEAQAEAETLKDAIKAEMSLRNVEELEAGQYRIAKQVTDFRKTADFDTQIYYAYFEITDTLAEDACTE